MLTSLLFGDVRRSTLLLCTPALSILAACSSDVEPSGTAAADPPSVADLGDALTPETLDVLTQRNDNGRTGSSVHAGLNASTFDRGNAWGYAGEIPVDGDVVAQPLYASNLAMVDGLKHDVVFVATRKTQVSAFDANTLQRLWQLTFDPSGRLLSTPVIDRARGRIYVSFQAHNSNPALNSSELEHRILALNLASGSIAQSHIVSSTFIGAQGVCSDGAELCGIDDAFVQRAALLLVNGIVYVGFAGANEEPNPWFSPNMRYRGQLLGFDADSLDLAGRFITVQPGAFGNRLGGGIWQGAMGPAADAAGDIYIATGNIMTNAHCDAPGHSSCASSDECGGTVKCLRPTDPERATNSMPEAGTYGNSVVHLHPQVLGATGGHRNVRIDPVAWFTPYRSYWHNEVDLDFGSAGPVLVPSSNELVVGGKESILYLLDRNAMKSTTTPLTQREYEAWKPQTQSYGGCNANPPAFIPNDPGREDGGVEQEIVAGHNFDIPAPPMDCWTAWPHIHGSPVLGDLSDGNGYMYVWPEKDYLKAYRRSATSPVRFTQTPVGRGDSAAPVPAGMPGGMLALTTDPAGGGVLFATVPIDGGDKPFAQSSGSLHAYSPIPDATGRLRELWNDNATSSYLFAKFTPPMIGGNKRVFVPTFSNKVIVYGAQSNDPVARSAQISVPNGHLAAVLQNAQYRVITAATIGADGAVHIFWKMNDEPWLPQQSATVTATGTAPPGAPITIVPESDGRTFDTFFVDNLGAVNWLSVVDGQSWVNHGAISDRDFAPVGAAVTAAIQGASTTDMFVVGIDGSINVFWKPAGSATFFHGPLPGSAGRFLSGALPPPGSASRHRACAPLSGCAHFAVGRRPGTTLSLVGPDTRGALQEIVLVNDGGPWSAPVAIAGAPSIPAAAAIAGGNHGGSGVAVLDVGLVGNDGRVYAAMNETGSWSWTVVSPYAFAPPGAEMTSARFPTTAGSTFFFFVAGNEGAVDAFVYDATTRSWSASLDAHTPSFGAIEPGAPIAAALQSSTAGAEVLDYFFAGKTGVYVSTKLQAATWTRPGWIFH